MSVGFLGREPYIRRVLGSDDEVDVVAGKIRPRRVSEDEGEGRRRRRRRDAEDSRRSQAVSDGRNEGVGIGREVHSGLVSRKSEERSNQPRVLVAKEKSETYQSRARSSPSTLCELNLPDERSRYALVARG